MRQYPVEIAVFTGVGIGYATAQQAVGHRRRYGAGSRITSQKHGRDFFFLIDRRNQRKMLDNRKSRQSRGPVQSPETCEKTQRPPPGQQSVNVLSGRPRATQHDEIATITQFSRHILPWNGQVAHGATQPEVPPPRDGEGNDLDIISHLEQGPAERGIGVVVRHEPANFSRMNDKQNCRPDAASRKSGQFFQVPSSSSSNSVGKHGDVVAEERAGLHLKIDGLPVRFQEEVEAAVAQRDLGADDSGMLQAGHEPTLQEVSRHVIIHMGVKKDRAIFSCHADHRIRRLPRRRDGGGYKINLHAGQQQFLESPWIG